MRESLRERSNFSFDNYVDGLWSVLERVGIHGIQKRSPLAGYSGTTYDFAQSPYEVRAAATEAFFYLIHQGYVMPGAPTHLAGFPNQGRYYLTARGQAWAAGGDPLPEDFDGYMAFLGNRNPKLDPIIRQYISEGLTSFVRGTYFAAAVMIGAACEKALYLLADSMLDALQNDGQRLKLEKLLRERKLNSLFRFLRVEIEKLEASRIFYVFTEGASCHLLSLIESVRVQRNDAVHPMNANVSADSVRHSLSSFPHAISKIDSLREWLSEHPQSI